MLSADTSAGQYRWLIFSLLFLSGYDLIRLYYLRSVTSTEVLATACTLLAQLALAGALSLRVRKSLSAYLC